MAKKRKILAICPNCGLEFPDRDFDKEPTYHCVECGVEGYDCCVPGNNTRCVECENGREFEL